MEKESRTFSKNEHKVAREVSRFFARLEKEILKNLKENWDYITFSFQLPKITEPIIKSKDEYLELLDKELEPIYQNGRNIANRRYEYAKQKRILQEMSRKSNEEYFYSSSLTKRIKKIRWTKLEGSNIGLAQWTRKKPNPIDNSLFGYSSDVNKELHKNNFVASEKTMNRVDNDINRILATSYSNGEGIDETGKRIQRKFDQLKGYEANRIARTETHTAQELGVQAEYDNLGVEYIQWLTHIDERTRTSHEEINKEIIPRGTGRFSNGLRYPGDKSGNIAEWINCRCADIPYIPPYGMMFPPGQPRYHESDLIPNPNVNTDIQKFSIDDLLSGEYKNKLKGALGPVEISEKRINELMNSFRSSDFNKLMNMTDDEFIAVLDKYESLMERYYSNTLSIEDELFMDKFENLISFHLNNENWRKTLNAVREDYAFLDVMIYDNYELDSIKEDLRGLSNEEALKVLDKKYGITEQYLRKFKGIFLNIRNKSGDNVYADDLVRFVEDYFPNILPKQKIKDVDLRRLTELQRERYELLLEDYENGMLWEAEEKEFKALQEAIHDTNINRISYDTIDFKYPSFLGRGESNGELEEFVVYSFKNENYQIYISKELDNTYLTATNIRKLLKKEKLLNDVAKKIVISNQDSHLLKKGGWSTFDNNIVVLNSFKKDARQVSLNWGRFKSTIAHELGHNIDDAFGVDFFSSDDSLEGFVKQLEKDHIGRKKGLIRKTKRDRSKILFNKQVEHNDSDPNWNSNEDKVWISAYARNKRYDDKPDFTEAWAECIEAYINDKKWFKTNYPNAFDYIDDLFKTYEKNNDVIRFFTKKNIPLDRLNRTKLKNDYIGELFSSERTNLYDSFISQNSKRIKLDKKEEIELEDLTKLRIYKKKLPDSYEKRYQELSSKKRFNELYSLKLKHKGLNRKNTKIYIKEYLKLREAGYKFSKGKLDVFKDIDINFALGKDNRSILKELYSGGYVSRLRYKLGLIDLTDEEIYYLLSMYLTPTSPGLVRGATIALRDWLIEDN